ncbi:MAG: hypothetical protein EBU90_14200 [Proteobacteria bacterium]|nr:hypothetical protein [Pseudomonadota bacterium]NBP14265.1 hypothetical protein [bacterium]
MFKHEPCTLLQMALLFYFTIGLLSGVSYVYRRQIFRWMFAGLWYLARLYINYKLSKKRDLDNKKGYVVLLSKQEMVYDNIPFYVYEYLKDSQKFKVFGSRGEEPMLSNVDTTIEQNLVFKHNVLNCSIKDNTDDDNCLLDITTKWRECLYHYQGQSEMNKMKYFFTYLMCISGIQSIKDKYLVTYVNDDSFSEHTYKIADIWEKYFYEVNEITIVI